jgi:hypothetical protein
LARFYLMEAHFFKDRRYKAGTIIADSLGVAQPGDQIVTTLNSGSVTPSMKPLDASAVTMKSASLYPSNNTLASTIAGNQSIDA